MLAITPGEPAGIGPDLVIRLAQQQRRQDWVVLADADMLAARAQLVGLQLSIDSNLSQPSREAGHLTVRHLPLANIVQPGLLDCANVPGVLAALDAAIQGCLNGTYAGLVTGPMQKSVVNDAGIAFSGHTEYLADAAGVDDVVMLLVAGTLRVALATTHMPLRQVPESLTAELLSRRLNILHTGLQQRFGVPQPHILVAGLNPHAGESGHLGREEIETITPVLQTLRRQGLHLSGPLPADTLFTPGHLDTADAVMAMFHDQGLPVLKYAGFGEAVNVTLGLPFVRTSVDHGTALELAGSDNVATGSMAAALALADTLAQAAVS
ncbi:MAG: 4-hydroxythreonine-4-phosphate dehydrogenase PdxA [bacterium]